MTQLNKPIHRVANKEIRGKPIVITLFPGSDKREDVIGLRIKGERTTYHISLSQVYYMAALNHANKVKAAKAEARKAGEPWAQAKKRFNRNNKLAQ